MAVIQELPSHLADLIAAGEVVERPASVAKELVENAIDAGATRITVEIEGGGISYLRIADNGCGMAPEDAATAFRRHATSKIRTEDDLTAIRTLGFRGEALAAISAVSHIDLFTKQAGTLAGIHLHLDAGTLAEQEEAGCPDGTTMIIRDLFYNTPARMKFLKKNFTEAGYVLSVVQHAALSHPEIAFAFLRDGKQTFSSAGDGQLKTPVFSVFGRELLQNMLEVPPFERDGMTVWGYITKPHCARPNRSLQHFFVNGRYVKSRLIQAALEESYKNAIIGGKYPSGALCLTVPYSMVDVNVHPAKTEVKFALEKPVFEAVYIACKNTLEAGDNAPLLKQKPVPVKDQGEQQILAAPRKKLEELYLPPQKGLPVEELPLPQRELSPPVEELPLPQRELSLPSEELPLEELSPSSEEPSPPPAAPLWQEPKRGFLPYIDCDEADMGLELCASAVSGLFQSLPAVEWGAAAPLRENGAAERVLAPVVQMPLPTEAPAMEEASTVEEASIVEEAPAVEKAPMVEDAPAEVPAAMWEPSPFIGGARVLGEAFHTYIIAEEGDGLILVDKHAAHERMIFNRLRAETELPSQTLLTPVISELPPEQASALTEGMEQVQALGFDIEPFGSGSFAVRAIPAYLDAADVASVLFEIAEKLDSHRAPTPGRLDDLIHTVSCKAAIKAGSHSALSELQEICSRVLSDPEVRACPHGRPTMVRLTKHELDKLFKRINP